VVSTPHLALTSEAQENVARAGAEQIPIICFRARRMRSNAPFSRRGEVRPWIALARHWRVRRPATDPVAPPVGSSMRAAGRPEHARDDAGGHLGSAQPALSEVNMVNAP